jgi:hypothetical protein
VRRRVSIAVLSLFCIGVGGCSSPESMRTRSGGRGGDVGNRGEVVRMHEGSKPYANTPKLIPAQNPALDSASHADQLSRK